MPYLSLERLNDMKIFNTLFATALLLPTLGLGATSFATEKSQEKTHCQTSECCDKKECKEGKSCCKDGVNCEEKGHCKLDRKTNSGQSKKSCDCEHESAA